jgi:hypothetical protein
MRPKLRTITERRPHPRSSLQRRLAGPEHGHAPTRPATASERERSSGGPLDHATYSCSCGYVFQADVCTTVDCPHCGTSQAW